MLKSNFLSVNLICEATTTRILPLLFLFLNVSEAAQVNAGPRIIDADVCVYAATPSGILAALAVEREGHSVVVVEPSRWAGGMLGAGLKPMQDCPNYAATGGMTRKLLVTLGQPGGVPRAKDKQELSPKDVRYDLLKLLTKHGINVIYEHRIAHCEKRDTAIATAVFDLAPFDDLGCPVAEPKARASLHVTAKVFIDASYEGDLMAKAGVSYRVGREAVDEFGETSAGVQPPMELTPIDPFVEPGHPKSGLLKWIEDDHGKGIGSADGYTQAYNYRYYTTANPDHHVPITPPDGYDANDFEIVGRYVEHLTQTIADAKKLRDRLVGICPGWMNAGEWNYQRSSLISMAPLGISQMYADGDYAAKARVWKQHQDYLRGLFHFMRTDERVPQVYRDELAKLGLDKRFHPDTQGWPHQLYVRVARRMLGPYTITAHDVYNKKQINDPIGLAQYGIDTYPSRRIWFRRDGRTWVGIEGKMFIGGNRGPTNVPYQIPYRAITPSARECANLLVPVCFSATHLGYASARMEPVFMICGESAGIAACRAMEENTTVQNIDMTAYKEELEEAGQKLSWNPKCDRSTALGSSGHAVRIFKTLLRECDSDQDDLVSNPEWNAGKPTWQWLFKVIDTDQNGKIDEPEYHSFQDYKAKNPDWRKLQPDNK